MASEEVQRQWTGATGAELLKQSLSFVRILEAASARYMAKSPHDSTILDFGCGYGRIIRLLYYYTGPNNIWGIDAWNAPLEMCRADGLICNLEQSHNIPDELPVGNTTFDLGFAFSVFTHLSPQAARSSLRAIRRHMKKDSVFISTIRPVEFWKYLDEIRGTSIHDIMIDSHRKIGFAYLPHSGEEGATYGDISLQPKFFDQDGWQILGYERSLHDPFEIAIILRAT